MRSGHVLSYADHVGLVLNAPRQELRRAAALARALFVANSTDSLSRDWADAVSDVSDPAVIDEILFQANAARHEAKVKAKIGWPT